MRSVRLQIFKSRERSFVGVPVRRRYTQAQYVADLGVDRDLLGGNTRVERRSGVVVVVVVGAAAADVFAISAQPLAACNGLDATPDHPHYLFFLTHLRHLIRRGKTKKRPSWKLTTHEDHIIHRHIRNNRLV